jgi:hypothetical protein
MKCAQAFVPRVAEFLIAISLIVTCGCPGESPPPPSTRPASTPPASKNLAGEKPSEDGDDEADGEVARATGSTDGQAAGTEADREPANTEQKTASEEPPVGETLFRGWPIPKLALFLTGEQLGYIEPCGCSGLENQKGGLRRRHTLLKQLRDKGWPVVALDNGGLIKRSGLQAELKFEKTAEALVKMGYSAVGFGTDDLKLQAGSVMAVLANFDAGKNPFVSANVGVITFDDTIARRFLVVEHRALRIGVTAVLGDKFQKQITNDEINLLPAKQGLAEACQELEQADCEPMVLLAHATPEESTALARQYPAFDVVVTAGGADEPPHVPTMLNEGRTMLIEVGHKGMFAVVIGFYDDEETPVRYQRVPIDKRFADSPDMDKVMESYQDQLQQMGWEGLDLRRTSHPGGKFAGSSKCAECHQQEFDIWAKTPHAHATKTLTTVKPPRQFDPECISCHATGWNPQRFTPYTSGFDSLKLTADLAGNGCENCHGPAAAHVAAEINGGDDALRAKLRLSIAEAKTAIVESCLECHDLDNSPHFDFDEYWPKIEH